MYSSAPPLSGCERQRRYRARLKSAESEEALMLRRQQNAERQRTYRARRRAKIENQQLEQEMAIDNQMGSRPPEMNLNLISANESADQKGTDNIQ